MKATESTVESYKAVRVMFHKHPSTRKASVAKVIDQAITQIFEKEEDLAAVASGIERLSSELTKLEGALVAILEDRGEKFGSIYTLMRPYFGKVAKTAENKQTSESSGEAAVIGSFIANKFSRGNPSTNGSEPVTVDAVHDIFLDVHLLLGRMQTCVYDCVPDIYPCKGIAVVPQEIRIKHPLLREVTPAGRGLLRAMSSYQWGAISIEALNAELKRREIGLDDRQRSEWIVALVNAQYIKLDRSGKLLTTQKGYEEIQRFWSRTS